MWAAEVEVLGLGNGTRHLAACRAWEAGNLREISEESTELREAGGNKKRRGEALDPRVS